MGSRMRLGGGIAGWACVLALALVAVSGCQGERRAQPLPAQAPVTFDRAAEKLALPAPAVQVLDVLPQVEALSEGMQAVLDLRRAFFRGDFDRLEAGIARWREEALRGSGTHPGIFLLAQGLATTQMAGVDRCEQWLRLRPESYVAHWICGWMWSHSAWVARGDGHAKDISRIRMVLMDERLERALALFERAVRLHAKPVEALVDGAAALHARGQREEAEQWLAQAEGLTPAHSGLHEVRMNFAQPKWGGSREEVLAAFARAKAMGMTDEGLGYLETQYLADAPRSATPGVSRNFWLQRVREAPNGSNLDGLLESYRYSGSWIEALPIADQLARAWPNSAHALYRRGEAREKLGQLAEARADYWRAAAMGHDDAMHVLVMANLRGGLGQSARDVPGTHQLCRYGAALGMPTALNCIGALYHEGGSPDAPFERDPAQSLAWHLMAARAGSPNSQHDLGWLLLSGRAAGLDRATAEAHGVFWLRRAAANGHEAAQGRLAERRLAREEEPGTSGDSLLDFCWNAFLLLRQVLKGPL